MLASPYRTRAVAGVCLLVIVAFGAALLACETPVYRYAMYRWSPEPYEVYFFYDGETSETDAGVQQALEEAAEAWANISLIKVDLSVENAIDRVTPDVHQWWMSEENRKLPIYLVKNPMGLVVHAGSLTTEAVADLVQSPARQHVGERLERGEAAVFVLLEGADAAANQIAARELAGVVKNVNSGKIDLYSSPISALPVGSELAENASDDADSKTEAASPKVTVGHLIIKRNDPKEQWFIKTLLAVESDLPELTGPMVFAVYGRARALPPYVGAGITRDNLQDCIEFVTGACSCTVKEENPGVDLLLTYNWDDAALALKEKFGSEEGSEGQFGGLDLFPQLIVTGEAPQETDLTITENGSATEGAAAEVNAESETTAEENSTTNNAAAEEVALVDNIAVDTAASDTAAGEANLVGVSSDIFVHDIYANVSATLFLTLGLGVGLVLLLLLGATFFMFRGH